jgi:hypothetical protein
MVSKDCNLKKFLDESLYKAGNVSGELTMPHMNDRGYFKVGSDDSGTLLDFYVKHPPDKWNVGVERLDAGNYSSGGNSTINVYLQGCVKNISAVDSTKVAKFLPSLLNSPFNCMKLDMLKVYDSKNKTVAILKSAANNKLEECVVSNKESRNEIRSNIRHIFDISLQDVVVPGLGEGISIISDNNNMVDIMENIIADRGAEIKEMTIGVKQPGKIMVGMGDAKKFVFQTHLKKIAHADVNCLTDNGVMTKYDATNGAVYVSNDDLRIKVRTADKLKVLGNMFLSKSYQS